MNILLKKKKKKIGICWTKVEDIDYSFASLVKDKYGQGSSVLLGQFFFNEYREKACAFQSQSFDRDILMNNNNTLY